MCIKILMIWVCLLAEANNFKIYLTYTCLADILIDHYKEGYGVIPRWTNIMQLIPALVRNYK